MYLCLRHRIWLDRRYEWTYNMWDKRLWWSFLLLFYLQNLGRPIPSCFFLSHEKYNLLKTKKQNTGWTRGGRSAAELYSFNFEEYWEIRLYLFADIDWAPENAVVRYFDRVREWIGVRFEGHAHVLNSVVHFSALCVNNYSVKFSTVFYAWVAQNRSK